ncbi:MAG: hypothetical protein ABIX46_14720 [Burkholderiaceae bacterium]
MKTHDIEVQRFKSMAHARGLIEMQVDASVVAAAPGAATTTLRMTEDTARVLQALLRHQLAEVDKRKGRSQR